MTQEIDNKTRSEMRSLAYRVVSEMDFPAIVDCLVSHLAKVYEDDPRMYDLARAKYEQRDRAVEEELKTRNR